MVVYHNKCTAMSNIILIVALSTICKQIVVKQILRLSSVTSNAWKRGLETESRGLCMSDEWFLFHALDPPTKTNNNNKLQNSEHKTMNNCTGLICDFFGTREFFLWGGYSRLHSRSGLAAMSYLECGAGE